MKYLNNLNCILLAAGYGTRLKDQFPGYEKVIIPLSQKTPKHTTLSNNLYMLCKDLKIDTKHVFVTVRDNIQQEKYKEKLNEYYGLNDVNFIKSDTYSLNFDNGSLIKIKGSALFNCSELDGEYLLLSDAARKGINSNDIQRAVKLIGKSEMVLFGANTSKKEIIDEVQRVRQGEKTSFGYILDNSIYEFPTEIPETVIQKGQKYLGMCLVKKSAFIKARKKMIRSFSNNNHNKDTIIHNSVIEIKPLLLSKWYNFSLSMKYGLTTKVLDKCIDYQALKHPVDVETYRSNEFEYLYENRTLMKED